MSDRLGLSGFLGRFAFAVLVVGATYNPTGYSYYAWAEHTGWQWGWLPIQNVAAISWLGLVCVSTILAVGMSWSRLRRSRPA